MAKLDEASGATAKLDEASGATAKRELGAMAKLDGVERRHAAAPRCPDARVPWPSTAQAGRTRHKG